MSITFNKKKTGPRLLWSPPTDLPSLKGAAYIAVDTETRDDGINEGLGPGGVLGKGHLLGISVCAFNEGMRPEWSGYIPLRHPETDNFSASAVTKWVASELTSATPKIGANILYDLEWLHCSGMPISGPFYDVQLAEPLLDETKRKYNLASLGATYLEEKFQKAVGDQELLAREYLGDFKGDVRKHLYKLPASHVGGYAEMDAISTGMIFTKQRPRLEAEDLWDLFLLECRLVPLLLAMRLKGVRVDEGGAEKLQDKLKEAIKVQHYQLKYDVGFDVNVSSARSVAQVFDHYGIPYGSTAKGNPTFTKEWLEAHPSPVAGKIRYIRKLEKLLGTFVENGIFKHIHNGRIHCQFHQLRGDENGTVSGRFSSSDPNLQQVPSQDDELAAMIRSLFIPEEGKSWWKADYSQIEYRMIVHYAYISKLRRADEAREMYVNNPDTDFHQWCADVISAAVGKPFDRRPAKNINFGLAYGMGKPKLARSLGLEKAEAEHMFELYHEQVPFITMLSRNISKAARQRGYVKTILNRRRRFSLYEPKGNFGENKKPALPVEEALAAYGPEIIPAGTHKALNAVIQGSAADLLKKAMVDYYEAGCYAVLGPPSLTVHDELCGSVDKSAQQKAALKEAVYIMANCLPISVPILVDLGIGPNWYDLTKVK